MPSAARPFLAIFLGCTLVSGQPLVNDGKPMRVPYTCTDEEIHALGLDCAAEDPCAVFLELAGLEAAGSKIFLAGNIHTAATTIASVLLASDDDGKTWSEPHERIRSAGLEQIQFIDFERGWAAGQQLQTIPRDPFFLITTDGGKNWRRRPVAGDGQVGAIDQFWFDTRDDGIAVIDRMQSTESGARFSIYETRTGGDSWMIREIGARAPRLKRAAGQNPDRRIRADASTRSFVIERRDGERWQSLASFRIEIGSCRPAPPRPPAEPPPEPPVQDTAPSQPKTPPTLKKKP